MGENIVILAGFIYAFSIWIKSFKVIQSKMLSSAWYSFSQAL